jgi:uncharacterized delta-60 repeat protein
MEYRTRSEGAMHLTLWYADSEHRIHCAYSERLTETMFDAYVRIVCPTAAIANHKLTVLSMRQSLQISLLLCAAAASSITAVTNPAVAYADDRHDASASATPGSAGLLARTLDGRFIVARGSDIDRELTAAGKLAPILVLHSPYSDEDAKYSSAAFCVMAFRDANALDPSFGLNGATLTPLRPLKNRDVAAATALLVDNAGRSIVVGWRTQSTWLDSGIRVLTAVRHTSVGALDRNFGDNGIVTLRVEDAGVTQGYAAALDNAGRLLIAGYNGGRRTRSRLGSFDDYSVRAMLVRYTARGTLDATFGADGVALHTIEEGGPHGRSGSDFLRNDDEVRTAKAAALLPENDGGTLIAIMASDGALHLLRFDADGKLDVKHGEGGDIRTPLQRGARIASLLRDAAGRLLVIGTQDDHILLLRYTAEGKPDAPFGGTGMRTIAMPAGVVANAAAFDREHRLLLVASGAQKALLTRVDENGVPDESFASDGTVIFDFDMRIATQAGLSFDQEDRPVIAVYGGKNLAQRSVALVRFNGSAADQAIAFRSTAGSCGAVAESEDH